MFSKPVATVQARQNARNSWGPLILATVVSALGGFLFGYDNIVISGAIGHLTKFYRLDPTGVGWAAGCALIGCLIGSAGSGALADRLGLKRALYGCAACFALSSLGVWYARNFTEYVVWRIVGGIGIGAASIVAPMYIAEIAPRTVRGRLVVFYQFGIVAGILSAVCVNLLIERSANEAWQITHGWRWMFAAAALPAVLFAVTTSLSAESPRWLIKMGKEEEGERVLQLVSQTPEEDAKAIKSSLAEEMGGFKELVNGPFRHALIIGFVLAGLSQMSGITCLLSYLPEVFKSAGRDSNDAFFETVLVGAVNLVFTLAALWLVDRAGRRTLILFGTCMQALSLGVVGLLYLSQGSGRGILAGIMAFVAGHAVGNGAVCWVVISEIFPTKVRGAAMSFATTAIWIVAYLANQFFPIMQNHLHSYGTFFTFSAMAALNFLFVLSWVPETKGYSLEDISRFWLKRSTT